MPFFLHPIRWILPLGNVELVYFIFRLVGLSPKEVKMLDQIQRACREQT
jgi:hypothetical protein